MILFIIRGLLRDRSRSLFPFLTTATGVMISVLLTGWIAGIMNDTINLNARMSTGHVKIMSRAYAELAGQAPNDLALLGVDSLLTELRQHYPDLDWTPRIRFGGLVDVPDDKGETRAQGPAMGLGVNLLDRNSIEWENLNLKKALVRGRFPSTPREVLLSDEFATKLELNPGDQFSLVTSTMNGALAIENFTLAGTVRFGVKAMDRGAFIVDITGVREALDMEDGAGEILGFYKSGIFNLQQSEALKVQFNRSTDRGEFAPIMVSMTDQNDMGTMLSYVNYGGTVIVGFFIFTMSIVLWNSGLMGSLRRYGEMGIRLAIGESKGHVYQSLILESWAVGLAGSVVGTALGLVFVYILQVKGIYIGDMLQSSAIMMSDVMRAQMVPSCYYIGFIPGLGASTVGAAISGLGIFRRETAQLFKELEA